MKRKRNGRQLLLLVPNFLNVFGWALLTPIYALYATQLGASVQMVTFSWGFYTLLAGTLMIVFGWLEDHSFNKPLLLGIGYLIQTVGTGLLFLAHDLTFLFAGLGCYAVGSGIVMPVWKVIYSRSGQRGREATSWGIFHGMNMLLGSLAATISGALLVLDGFRPILGLMFGAHLVAAVVTLKARKRF